MNHKETMKKLEQLYEIAVENKDVLAGVTVVEAMIRSGAAEASNRARPSVVARESLKVGV